MNGNIFKNTAFSLLTIPFVLFLLSVIGFIFHISINIYYPIISFIFGVVILFLITKKTGNSKKEFYISLSIILIVVLLSLLFGLSFYDYSYDGRGYHQASIIFLGNGWNPIYDNIYDFAANYYNNAANIDMLRWSEHYTKFVEIIQSNVYVLTGNVEIAKMTNVVFAAVLFMYSYYVLNKKTFSNINKFLKIFIPLIIVFNPIFVAQYMTFYIDSYVYILFMLMILSIIDIETNQKFDYIACLIFTISAISIANVKFGGLLYLFVTLILYFKYLFILKKKQKILLLFASSIIILISLVLSGINPYITNVCKHHRHLFHPLMGKFKIDVISNNSPMQFVDSFYLKNLFLSTFSKMDNFNYYSCKHVSLKPPFRIYRDELKFYIIGSPDVRVCGFGVLWSGIVFLSIILAFFIMGKDINERRLLMLIFHILLICTILNPYCWWARYATHLWVLPIFICITVLNKQNITKFEYVFSYIILFVMLLNVIIQMPYISKYERTYRKLLNEQISDLKGLNKPIKIYYICDFSLIENLKSGDIKLEPVNRKYYEEHKSEFSLIPIAIDRMYWDKKE